MPGRSIFMTQQVTARASGITGMAWCRGPCSSVSVVGGPADDCDGTVSIRGGSLICTVRLDDDAVRPTAECSLGTGSWALLARPPPPPAPPAPGPASDDEVHELACTSLSARATRLVTSGCVDICSSRQTDGCAREIRNTALRIAVISVTIKHRAMRYSACGACSDIVEMITSPYCRVSKC